MAETSTKATEAVETVQDKAKDVAGQAQDQAGQLVDKARGPISSQVDQRSTALGDKVKSNADDVRSVALLLQKEGNDAPAKLAEQAADRAEKVGNWLADSDGDKILSDVEDFSRRNPWVLAAGALAVGFAASRALKASSSQRYATRAVVS